MTTLTLRDVRSADWPGGDAASGFASERATPATRATPAAVMLLLHGYGSNEHDLAGLAPTLDLGLPWASLRAPLEMGGGGAAWFAITTPGDPDPEPLADATAAIWDWVEANVASGARVVPVGFSQGGLMVSQLLRTRPERVLAPVILGGFVGSPVQPGDALLADTRPALFWGRGADDRVIGPAAIARTSAFLPGHSTLTERVYPGLAHGIHAPEVADVRAFVAAELAAAAE